MSVAVDVELFGEHGGSSSGILVLVALHMSECRYKGLHLFNHVCVGAIDIIIICNRTVGVGGGG